MKSGFPPNSGSSDRPNLLMVYNEGAMPIVEH